LGLRPGLAGAQGAHGHEYDAGRYALVLSGIPMFVKDVGGGNATADAVQAATDPKHIVQKHLGDPQYSDMSVKIAPGAVSKEVAEWMSKAASGRHEYKDGTILSLDAAGKPQWAKDFLHAVATEVDLPLLDASSKDPVYLDFKFKPEVLKTHTANSNEVINPTGGANAKVATGANFLVTFPSLGDLGRWVSSVGAVSVKAAQNMKQNEVCSPLVITAIEAHADALFQLFQAQSADKRAASQTASVELLTPDLKTVLYHLDLRGLKPVHLQKGSTDPKADQVHRVTAEFSCEGATLTFPSHASP